MNRVFSHFERHVTFSPEAVSFFYDCGRIRNYSKGEVIKLASEPFHYFVVVLEGLVGGYQPKRTGHISLREVVTPLDFFTGTHHLFTRRNQAIEYKALLDCQALCIPIELARSGQLEYPVVAEIFHIMKQRKINMLRQLVILYRESNFYQRYSAYRALLPDYATALPHFVQQELLGMSETTYYRVKCKFLKRPQP